MTFSFVHVITDACNTRSTNLYFLSVFFPVEYADCGAKDLEIQPCEENAGGREECQNSSRGCERYVQVVAVIAQGGILFYCGAPNLNLSEEILIIHVQNAKI